MTPITNARNAELEVEASTSFLRIVHAALPTAAIDDIALLRLRGGEPDAGGGKPHTSRRFKLAGFRAAFERTKEVLRTSMLAGPLPANSQAIRWHTETHGGRTLKAKFVSENFDMLEVDCIVKVSVRDPAGIVWGVDPSVTEAVGVRLQLLDSRASALPVPVPRAAVPPAAPPRLPSGDEAVAAPAPATLPISRGAARRRNRASRLAAATGPHASGAVFRKTSVAEARPRAALKPPSVPLDMTSSAAPNGGPSSSSSSSEASAVSGASSRVLYEYSANMYVVAEVYAALHDADDGDTGSLSDVAELPLAPDAAAPPSSRQAPVGRLQKLLQLERILTFICAKEGKPVLDCVAGAMFIGTRFDTKLLKLMRSTLDAYSQRFPCLQLLRSRGRLLIVHMPEHRLAGHLAQVGFLRLEQEVRSLRGDIAAQGSQLNAAIRDAVASVSSRAADAEADAFAPEPAGLRLLYWLLYVCVIAAIVTAMYRDTPLPAAGAATD